MIASRPTHLFRLAFDRDRILSNFLDTLNAKVQAAENTKLFVNESARISIVRLRRKDARDLNPGPATLPNCLSASLLDRGIKSRTAISPSVLVPLRDRYARNRDLVIAMPRRLPRRRFLGDSRHNSAKRDDTIATVPTVREGKGRGTEETSLGGLIRERGPSRLANDLNRVTLTSKSSRSYVS